MGIKGYISANINYEELVLKISESSHRNYKLGPVAFEILTHFAGDPYLSTYQIFASHNPQKMAYKNIHKRIEKLHSLNFIEIVEEKELNKKRESIHNPIFYRLTTGGIFQIICKYQNTSFIEKWGLKLLQDHDESIIFRTLLYPYIDLNILPKVNNHFMLLDMLEEIFSYLYKCCVAINDTVELIYKQGSKMLEAPILNWTKPDQCSVWFLNSQFDLKFSDEVQIQKGEDEKMIKISDNHKSIILRLNDEKDLATLITDDNRNYELAARQSKNKLIVYAKCGTVRERALEKLAYDIDYILLNLAFFMIMRLRKEDFTQVAGEITPQSSPTSFEILLQDMKILSLLDRTRKLFNERYETFVELKKPHSK